MGRRQPHEGCNCKAGSGHWRSHGYIRAEQQWKAPCALAAPEIILTMPL